MLLDPAVAFDRPPRPRSFHPAQLHAEGVIWISRKHAEKQTEMALQGMSGRMTPEQRQAMAAEGSNQEDEIKALLTPEQLEAYPEFQRAEKSAAADKSANQDASQVASDFNLSNEQQEQIRGAFYQFQLNVPDRGLIQEAIGAARKTGDIEEIISKSIEQETSLLEEKVKILAGVLSQNQLDTYREEATKGSNRMASAMKALFPQKPTGTDK